MDFYLILGLERSASSGEIKRAYKRLARSHQGRIDAARDDDLVS